MMKKVAKIAFSLVLALSVTFGVAQERRQRKADKLYEKYAYVDAIKVYERIVKKGYVNQDVLEKLANSYYFNADFQNALKWYDQLFQLEKTNPKVRIQPETYFRYAQALKTQERYAEADKVLEQFFAKVSKNDALANAYAKNKNYLQKISENSGRFTLKPVSINTKESEYGVAFYGDDAVVYSGSKKPGFWSKVSPWTGATYYNLYKGNKEKEDISNPKLFSSVLNTSLNESTATFSKDMNVVYFTRNNYSNRKKGANADGVVLLKLYKSERKANGDWKSPVELPFNSDSYSTAHPALSPDGKYLYFASDMAGTKGKSDIFRVEIKADGSYGKPENLGDKINTRERESFPFVSDDNVLYFSSDGLPGLGGLDIFAVKINPDGSLGVLQNIGKPGNSPADDFAFVLNTKTKEGFLTSNRPGGQGKDDIYAFTEKVALNFQNYLAAAFRGTVRDAETNEVIADAQVSLLDKRQSQLGVTKSVANGAFDFGKKNILADDNYVSVVAQKQGYMVAEERVAVKPNQDTNVTIYLKSSQKRIKVGDDLAKFFGIQNIYFAFDKSNIKADAAVDLAKVVEVLKQYPNMKIAINSHTDSRGTKAYNQKLSERRAESTKKWIISKGISADRLQAKGFGESQLVNKCADGVKCSSEEHYKNRRSEFIVIEL